MRKNLFFLALGVVAAAGCAKCHDAELDPKFKPIEPEEEKVSFQATVDGPYINTKVSVPTSDFYTIWNQGDELLVIGEGKQEATYKAVVGQDIWTTLKYQSGAILSSAESNMAYYPPKFYSEGLPASYDYSEVSSESLHHLPMVAQTEAGSTEMKFKYMCGIAHFVYTNSSDKDMNISKIVLESKNPLSGKGTIIMGAIPAFILEGNGTVTINFGSEGKILKPGDPMHLYIPLPAELYKKLVANIYLVGQADPVPVKYSGKAMISRSEVTLLNLNFVPGPDDPIDGEDLSKNGTANCYVVTKAASYKFPAVKGNSAATETIPGIASVELLWESFNDYEAPEAEDFIGYYDYTRGWIVFDLSAGCYGNAVLAAKDEDGNILWSWHIWIPETEIGTETQKGVTLMDRHLGAPRPSQIKASGDALKRKFTPLLYQWGRKDPFPGTCVEGSGRNFMLASAYFTSKSQIPAEAGPVSMETAVANPTTFYTNSGDWCSDTKTQRWSSGKTIYDPCPAGWRVPDSEVWEKLAGATWTNDSGSFNDGQYSWPNELSIVGTSGAKGAGNTGVYWTTSNDKVGWTQYGKITSGKFGFHMTDYAKYPKSTGAIVRCQAQ